MDEQAVNVRLEKLLCRLLAGADGSGTSADRRLDLDADFSALGVNSVDLLEFVLGIEQEFGVRVLDDMLPEELPTTLRSWGRFLEARLPQAARSK